MIPSIIHPRRVWLRQREPISMDPEFGPASEATFGPPVALSGQIRYQRSEEAAPGGAGNDPVTDGHIVFLMSDWIDAGGAVGDEIDLEGGERLIVTEARPAAHYGGAPHHVHVYFTRRRARSR